MERRHLLSRPLTERTADRDLPGRVHRHARDAACAVDTGACRIINIKVGRVGGFTEAKKVHDVCQANRVPVWCGGMLESGVGRAHNIALSTLENFRLPGDVSASKRYWKEDIVEPEVEVSREGLIPVRDEPGTGYQRARRPDREADGEKGSGAGGMRLLSLAGQFHSLTSRRTVRCAGSDPDPFSDQRIALQARVHLDQSG